MDSIQTLKQRVREFRVVDDQIRDLNKQVSTLREQRKTTEVEIANLLKLPQFSAVDKLKIEDDGSNIRIQRPNTYSKPWTLTQKDLKSMITDYFATHLNHNADDCVNFVIQKQKQSLVAQDFTITRIISTE
jgi:hypothetical protein